MKLFYLDLSIFVRFETCPSVVVVGFSLIWVGKIVVGICEWFQQSLVANGWFCLFLKVLAKLLWFWVCEAVFEGFLMYFGVVCDFYSGLHVLSAFWLVLAGFYRFCSFWYGLYDFSA